MRRLELMISTTKKAIFEHKILCMKTNIYQGIQEDLPFVLEMIELLAVYEKEPNAVRTTLDDLKKHFMEERFEFYIATYDGERVGMALYYDTYSTWNGPAIHLEDFIVKDSHRKLGIGEAVFDKLKEMTRAKGCRLLKWDVLDWNEPAINFYKKIGASVETNWWNGRLVID